MTKVPTDYIGLARYLESHLRTEQDALERYEQLVADRADDDIVSYLVRTIIAEEHRHHQVFAEMLNALESKIQWTAIEPRVPSTRAAVENRAELLAATDELLAIERDDADELRELRKAWSSAGGELELWALLVEGAEFDTQKHIRTLGYLRQLIASAPDPP